MDWYSDPGFSPNGSYLFFAFNFFDNLYKCDNYLIKPFLAKTNKPASTEVRSPDVLSSYSATEQVIEHIAHYLKKDPLEIRRANFFTKTDSTALGHLLSNIDPHKIVDDLVESSQYYKRKEEIEQFNKVNKHKKKGISVMPLRYSMSYELGYYNALVSVRHSDGSVAVSHGGIEMGQGLSTKVAQSCAHELGVPLEKISVKATNNLVNPNALWTGASVTSELCCRVSFF
jgi:xanthine dehydrogenase/oxidase